MDHKFAIAITTMFFSRVYMESMEKSYLQNDLFFYELADLQSEVFSVFSDLIERTISSCVIDDGASLAGAANGQKCDTVDWSLVVELDDGFAVEHAFFHPNALGFLPSARQLDTTH